jgi:hypothetical protein
MWILDHASPLYWTTPHPYLERLAFNSYLFFHYNNDLQKNCVELKGRNIEVKSLNNV